MIMLSTRFQTTPPPVGGAFNGAPPLNAEALMLNVQLMVAKDYDEQMRRVGEQLRFLTGVKKSYRENVAELQNFLTANPSSSRKDGKKYVEASFVQMARLCGALTASEYDLESMTRVEKGLSITAGHDRHDLDEPDANGVTWAPLDGGKMDAGDLADYFAHGAGIGDPRQAANFAKRAGDDGNGLFFYFGHRNGSNENGAPQFSVFTDQIERLAEQLKNKLSAVEEDAERLGAKLSELSSQRKAALEGANQLISKMEQIRSNAIGKIG